ncbi:hypothetical protein UMM65_03515 [Aureibaculum sp. 2210JD6-5]|uniref:hypothetical protein n=1 Tax=Aureibaculum sp. 2210JD6-5 TaxID=3103957 RepID=UPI002AAC92AB|nr:hypothetical protein [Aureibaculum sp. 2210JD6-5]MDY7394294.1 hypothetical protein [Aureibaculum sp. 2210JD6-5]
MKKINYTLIAIIFFTLTNCSSDKHNFPVDKRYWDVNDYNDAVREYKFGYERDDKLPTFEDPETRIIVQKLTDEENYKVVLNDNELGIKHRNTVAEKFFEEWREMTRLYNALDRKDNYLYDKEMIAVLHFGLGLQLSYFELGNLQIKENADDPNSYSTKNRINSNISTLISNYTNYIDRINDEKAFTEEGKDKLAAGIDKYFMKLIALYPDANYGGMKSKANLMLKKSNSDKIKSSLKKLIQEIDTKAEEKKQAEKEKSRLVED